MLSAFHINPTGGKISIRTLTMWVSIALNVVFLTITGLVILNLAEDMITDSVNANVSAQITHLTGNLNKELNKLKNTTSYIAQDRDLISSMLVFYENGTTTYQKINAKSKVETDLQSLVDNNQYIKSVVIITDKMIYSTDRISFIGVDYEDMLRELDKYGQSPSQESVMLIGVTDHSELEKYLAIQDSRNVYTSFKSFDCSPTLVCRIDDNSSLKGYVYLTLDEELLSGLEKSDINALVVNDDNQVVWFNDQIYPVTDLVTEHIDQYFKNGQTGSFRTQSDTYSVYGVQSYLPEWKVIFLSNQRQIIESMRRIHIIIAVAFVISLLGSCLLSKLALRYVFRSISQLNEKMKRYKNGNEDAFAGSMVDSRFTLREKIITYFCVSVIIPNLIFMGLFYFSTANELETKIDTLAENTYSMAKHDIEAYLSDQENAIKAILFNPDFHDSVQDEDTDPVKLRETIKKMMVLYHHVYIYIMDSRGHTLYQNIWIEDPGMGDTENTADLTLSNTGWNTLVTELSGKRYLNRLIAMKLRGSDGSITLYLDSYIDETALMQVYEDYCGNGKMWIAQTDGVILSSSEHSDVGMNIDADEMNNYSGYSVIADKIAGEPWTLTYYNDSTSLISMRNGILYAYVLVTVIILLFIIILSYYISFIFLKPFNKLNLLFSKVGSGLNVIPESGYFVSEIEELVKSFNEMEKRIDDLIDEVLIGKITAGKLEEQKRALEQTVLQKQINPHFLYNTIESIRCIMLDKNIDQAAGMLANLNNLFRYGIGVRDSLVSIEKEIGYTKSFISIMDMRYSEKIEYRWDVNPGIEGFLTLKTGAATADRKRHLSRV